MLCPFCALERGQDATTWTNRVRCSLHEWWYWGSKPALMRRLVLEVYER